MATKEQGVSCYDKAAKDEELFVLRAQDQYAPHIVLEWIKMNIKTAPDEKLRNAFEVALRMRAFPRTKNPD